MSLEEPPGAEPYPHRLACENQLEAQFEKFNQTVRPPANFQGLLFASQRLRNVLRHEGLPSFWRTIEPFDRWADLFDVFLENASEMERLCGSKAGDGYFRPLGRRSVIHGQMEDYPIFAMVCTVHEDKSLDLLYGGLQLQVLRAHWEKIQSFHSETQRQGEVNESRKKKDGPSHQNEVKLALEVARAVRKFQPNDLSEWLTTHDPLEPPKSFLEKLVAQVPQDYETRKLHTILRRYCTPGYLPGSGGRGGQRSSSAKRYLFMLDYNGQRLGLLDDLGSGSEDPKVQPLEHLTKHHVRGEHNRHLSKKEIFDLGLDPLELSDGEIDVLTAVPKGGNRQEAIEGAHAQIRALEIDHRLYPWGLHAIRLEEFQKEILPHLQDVGQSSPSRAADSVGNIAAATAIAIAAETGRTLDQVQRLRVEETLSSPFAYCPATGGHRCGMWKWDVVSPRYKGDLTGNERNLENMRKLAVERAGFLIYPASELVTDLIARFTAEHPPKHNLLFPFRPKGFSALVRKWLQKKGVDGRFTLHRISRLIWDLLHVNTGGELASVCLTLGLPHPLAQVELFYAILHEAEAKELFARSTAMLWGHIPATTRPLPVAPDPEDGKFTGCRAFPKLQVVRRTIQRLREQSEAFFAMPIREFRPAEHRDRLNGAVLYGLWHQFFSFGTRAICDAYQELDAFSEHGGIGILNDKDFANGYKTRMVVAHPNLRGHMQALESKLKKLRTKLPGENDPALGAVWLLDWQNRPVALRPKIIQLILTYDNYDFPFPVNTPRKVMRYLLRKSGMAHIHSEAYMGHWWHGREPFSPFSSFDFGAYLHDLNGRMGEILTKKLEIRFAGGGGKS